MLAEAGLHAAAALACGTAGRSSGSSQLSAKAQVRRTTSCAQSKQRERHCALCGLASSEGKNAAACAYSTQCAALNSGCSRVQENQIDAPCFATADSWCVVLAVKQPRQSNVLSHDRCDPSRCIVHQAEPHAPSALLQLLLRTSLAMLPCPHRRRKAQSSAALPVRRNCMCPACATTMRVLPGADAE